MNITRKTAVWILLTALLFSFVIISPVSGNVDPSPPVSPERKLPDYPDSSDSNYIPPDPSPPVSPERKLPDYQEQPDPSPPVSPERKLPNYQDPDENIPRDLVLKQRAIEALKLVKSGSPYLGIENLITGEYAYFRGDEPCQWASTVKMATLLALMRAVETGEMNLEDRYRMTEEDRRLFSPILSHFDAGLNPTLRDYAYWMIARSDNTASDIMIHRIGLDRINRTLGYWDFVEFRITRTLQDLLSCFVGISTDEMKRISQEEQKKLLHKNIARYKSYAHLERESGALLQNQCTPRDMVRLVKVITNDANYPRKDLHEETMRILASGGESFTQLLPDGSRAYGKTGSLLSTVAGAALVIMPDGQEYIVAIAIVGADEPVSKLSPIILQMVKILTTPGDGEGTGKS